MLRSTLWAVITSSSALGLSWSAGAEEHPEVLIDVKEEASNNGTMVTDHPQIACILDRTIGSNGRDGLSYRLGMSSPVEISKAMNSRGYFFVEGYVAHGACDRAALWISREGRFMAVLSECAWPEIFTNDPELTKNPPNEIKTFVKEIDPAKGQLGDKQVAQEIPTPGNIPASFKFPSACTAYALKDQLAAWTGALEGRLCNSNSGFSDAPIMVRPPKREKAFLFDEPKACAAEPCPQRRRGYLIAGDYVAVAQEGNGFSCVRYQGQKTTTLGWISNSDLSHFDDNKLPTYFWNSEQDGETLKNSLWLREHRKRGQIWVRGLPDPNDWEGVWISGTPGYGGEMVISKKNGKLHVSLDANSGYNIGGTEGEIHADGRVADTVDDDVDCGLVLFRLNNAIYVYDAGINCGGQGVYLQGAYIRKP